MKSREIIEMIESGTAPMEKIPPDNKPFPTPDLDCKTIAHI